MYRVINFGAGPSALPEEVLKEAQKELLNWRGTGLSVMEFALLLCHFAMKTINAG